MGASETALCRIAWAAEVIESSRLGDSAGWTVTSGAGGNSGSMTGSGCWPGGGSGGSREVLSHETLPVS